MEWYHLLLIIFGGLVFLFITGFPVAFCFLLVTMVGIYFIWGGQGGLEQLTYSIAASVSNFALLPVPLFILMGELIFHSGLAPVMIEALDKWLGRLPGRLSLLAVGAGTLFSALTAVSMSTVAMLGASMTPEMEKRGYNKSMSIGPILGSGGLAHMVPPSDLGVILGFIAQISIGRILMAIIFPGLLVASIYATYIILRCRFQPSIAPVYETPRISLLGKVIHTVRYIFPAGIVVFLVIGVIFLGVATPTEASATGVFGTFILVAIYRRLNWVVLKKALFETLKITVMVFMILVGALAFSQILGFSGATRGLAAFATGFAVSPVVIFIFMQVVLIFLGCFIEVVSMMMVTVPVFMPVVYALGIDPVWFAVVYLVNVEVAAISPPFGLSLFVMKGVAPRGTTMGDIYRAALPFIGLTLIAIGIIIAFPKIALWLPSIMR